VRLDANGNIWIPGQLVDILVGRGTKMDGFGYLFIQSEIHGYDIEIRLR
jgi:hypothetical protein